MSILPLQSKLWGTLFVRDIDPVYQADITKNRILHHKIRQQKKSIKDFHLHLRTNKWNSTHVTNLQITEILAQQHSNKMPQSSKEEQLTTQNSTKILLQSNHPILYS